MCSDERQFQPLVMTQSPSTSIPTTFPSSSNLRSAWLTFLSGFELSLVLLITTFLKFPALSATLILRVWASRGVVVLLMANSTKPSPRSEEFTSTHFVSSRLWIRLTIFVFTTLKADFEKPTPYRSVQYCEFSTTGKQWKWTLKIAVYLEASKNRYSPSKSEIITPAIAGITSLDVLRGADWLKAYSFKTCCTCLEWSACEIGRF